MLPIYSNTTMGIYILIEIDRLTKLHHQNIKPTLSCLPLPHDGSGNPDRSSCSAGI